MNILSLSQYSGRHSIPVLNVGAVLKGKSVSVKSADISNYNLQ